MDERNRAILEEAWANVNRLENERENLMAELEQRAANEPYYPRSAETPLIYQQPEPAAAPTMDQATLERWNFWFDERFARAVQKRFEDFATIIGEQTGETEHRLLTEVKTLRAIIDALHIGLTDDVAELRNELRAMNAKNITPLRTPHVA